MEESELISLCKDKGQEKEIIYWTSEVYGFGKVLRRYGYYPNSFPLNIYFSHGVSHHDFPALNEYQNNAPAMLYFSPRLTKEYKKKSNKYCNTIISPNVFYRRKLKIEKNKNARGTMAFPCHTTPEIDDLTDYQEYCKHIRSLSEEFKPVSVCLHYHDINKGLHKVFMERGFEVVTAGNPFHPDFIERFYKIIKNFKYVTSNEIGSYAYYAVEMDIPFLLYGSPVQFLNVGDENIEKGKYDSFRNSKQMAKAMKVLGNFKNDVTEEQKEFVERELGVYDSISRLQASIILHSTFLMYVMNKAKNRLRAYKQKFVSFFKINQSL